MTAAVRNVAICLLATLTFLLSHGGALVFLGEPLKAHAQNNSQASEPQFLQLHIDEVTPTVVTDTSSRVVTVTGTVKNIGDRTVDNVSVRLQRGPKVTTSDALRTSLTLDQSRFETVGRFETVSTSLDRGERAKFTLTMPLNSDSEPSLRITDTGIYPLLVNVNGTPEYGGAARLDVARFLLPVLDVPGNAPSRAMPTAMTLLWPLADAPRMASGVAGSVNEPARLIDDDLAQSLASGGRLDGLLTSLTNATSDSVDRGHVLREATCLAVDPDLLLTVAAMTRGYVVVDNVTDPNGPAHPGTGTEAAINWLERLRALAATMCVTAVPFAQVDVGSVASIGDPQLSAIALTSPSDVIDQLLAVTSLRGFIWPDAGILSPAAAELTQQNGPATALLARVAVDGPVSGNAVRLLGAEQQPTQLDALLFDPSIGAAFAAVGETPQTPSYTPQDATYDLTRDSRTARLQDAFGAMTWPVVNPDRSPTSAPLLIVPPQLWTANTNELAALLDTAATLIRTGRAAARPLPDVLARPNTAPRPTTLAAPQQAVTDGVPEAIRGTVADQVPRINSLTGALVDDPSAQLTPASFTNPLREDLLRSMTLAHRRDATRSSAEQAAATRANQVAGSLDQLFGAVTVVSPGGVYTLASEQGPLPLVARNDLPIGVRVQLLVDAPAEVNIHGIGPTQLPPRGSRTLTVPTEIADSRKKIVVQFSLATADGVEFGKPTSVTVRSNAYGTWLAILTAGAGALLLVLAGRRLWHRFRGQPDRADEGYTRS